MSRKDRVGNLLRSEISDILRKEVSDPRIGFVSITEVEIGSDLQLAKVYISILGDEKKKKDAMKGLRSAAKHIRRKLGPRLDLKTIPEIEFVQDDSIERGDKVLNLMTRIEKEQAQK